MHQFMILFFFFFSVIFIVPRNTQFLFFVFNFSLDNSKETSKIYLFYRTIFHLINISVTLVLNRETIFNKQVTMVMVNRTRRCIESTY